MSRCTTLLLAIGVAAAAPPAALAEIYRWTDVNGVARFSDRPEDVPAEHRRDVTAELRDDGPGRGSSAPDAPAPPDAPPLPGVPEVAPPSPPLATGDPGALAARVLAMGALAIVAFALAGIAASLALMAFALQLACRFVGEEVPGFGRAVAVAAVQMVAGIALGGVLGAVALAGFVDPTAPALRGAQILLGIAVNAAVVSRMLAQAFGRALVVALLALVLVTAVGVAIGIAVALAIAGLAASGG